MSLCTVMYLPSSNQIYGWYVSLAGHERLKELVYLSQHVFEGTYRASMTSMTYMTYITSMTSMTMGESDSSRKEGGFGDLQQRGDLCLHTYTHRERESVTRHHISSYII